MGADMRRTLLFSGGLDSTIAYRLLNKPKPVYFKIGHYYEEAEVRTIKRINQWMWAHGEQFEATVVDGRMFLGDKEDAETKHVDMRNLLLAAMAGMDADIVYLAAVAGESGRDKAKRFLNLMSKTMSFSEGRPITFEAPFQRMTKSELVACYLRRYPSIEDKKLLSITRSCYSHGGKQAHSLGCGRCMACFRRWVAMTANGIYEEYTENPWEWKVVQGTNWREWLTYYKRTWVGEWPWVIKSNLEAAKAITRAREFGR